MEIDWSKIKHWPTFESLCSTILNYQDKSIKIYRSDGKDGAIDAISENGLTVYQFKFHKSSGDLIKDAKEELKKIKKIKDDKTHPYHNTWSKVNKWVLMTNSYINKNNENKWNKQIGQLFSELKIKAELRSGEELEKPIRLHSLIYNIFFKDSPASYLTLDDAITSLNEYNSVRENKDEYESEYHGREEELEKADTFFRSDKKVLLVTGEGGVGKSRFLIEAGNRALSKGRYAQEGKQVYWANVATLAYNKDFPGIAAPDIDHVILMDEPESIEFLQRLMGQLTNPGSRIKKWKFIIALSRYDQKIINFFEDYKIKKIVERVKLEPMKKESFNSLIDEQVNNLESYPYSKEDLKNYLNQYTGGHPIFLHVALSIMEKGGRLEDLPRDEIGIAKQYVDQMLKGKSEKTRKVLNWMSLYGEIRVDNMNRGALSFDDNSGVKFVPDDGKDKQRFIANQIKCDDITDDINSLEDIRILKRYGGLLKMKPDVIRDHIIFNSLVYAGEGSDSKSSSFGKLVENMLDDVIKKDGYFVPDLEKVITTLAKVDWYQNHEYNFKNQSRILYNFVSEVVKLAETTKNIKELFSIVDIAKHFAAPYPSKIVELVQSVLKNCNLSPIKEEYMFRELNQSDVLEKLPELLLEAARYSVDDGVRKNITNLAIQLLGIEKQNSYIGSHSASSVISTMIVGGPNILKSYQRDFQSQALEYIGRLKEDENPKVDFYQKLIKPLIAIVRTEYSFKEQTLTMKRTCLHPRSENYKHMRDIINEMWDTLGEGTKQGSKTIILQLFDQFVHDIHQLINAPSIDKIPKDVLDYYRQLNIEVFNKLYEKIQEPWVTSTDFREARNIWDWYCKYCKDTDLKKIADKCEGIFLNFSSNKFYTNICVYPAPYNIEEQINDRFEPLLRGKASKIERHILDGIDTIGRDKFSFCTDYLCDYFFVPNFDDKVIQEFINNAICSSHEGLRDFIRNIITRKLQDLRKKEKKEDVLKLLEDKEKLYLECEAKHMNNKLELIRFLDFVYSKSKKNLGETSELELKYLLDKKAIFDEVKRTVVFIHILTNILLSNSEECVEQYIDKYKDVLINVIENSKSKDSTNIVNSVIDRLLVSDITDTLYINMLKLIFEVFSKIPNLGDINSVNYSLLNIVVERQDKWHPDIFDFKKLLFERLKIVNKDGDNFFDAISISIDLFPIFRSPPYEDRSDDEVVGCFEEIMTELNNSRTFLGYELPKWFEKFNVNNEYVPKVVIKKIKELKDDEPIENITIWSRYAGFCGEGSEEWRNIADTIYRKFDGYLVGKYRNNVLWSLHNNAKIESWSGIYGEFSLKWQQDVDWARHKYENEKHQFIKEFYNLKFEEAKTRMNQELAWHKEEHGDE